LSCENSKQLVITAEYDKEKMPGPPFPLDSVELNTYYANDWEIKQLESNEVIDQVLRFKEKGLDSFIESVYLLTKK